MSSLAKKVSLLCTASQQANCETKHLSGPAGMISSPNYPNAYENNLDCHSYIYAFSGSTINITFLAFDTQTSHDWLSITCLHGKAFTSTKYSGRQIPADLTISSCILVDLYFHTDGSDANTFNTTFNTTGFSITFNIISAVADEPFQKPTVEPPQYQTVLILLGVAVLIIIIILSILLILVCRQKERNTELCNKYELPQRQGESTLAEAGLENYIEIEEPDYDKSDDMRQRLPSTPHIYEELDNHANRHEPPQIGETVFSSPLHEADLGNDIFVDEAQYDYPDDSQRRRPNTSAIYDYNIVFDE